MGGGGRGGEGSYMSHHKIYFIPPPPPRRHCRIIMTSLVGNQFSIVLPPFPRTCTLLRRLIPTPFPLKNIWFPQNPPTPPLVINNDWFFKEIYCDNSQTCDITMSLPKRFPIGCCHSQLSRTGHNKHCDAIPSQRNLSLSRVPKRNLTNWEQKGVSTIYCSWKRKRTSCLFHRNRSALTAVWVLW